MCYIQFSFILKNNNKTFEKWDIVSFHFDFKKSYTELS